MAMMLLDRAAYTAFAPDCYRQASITFQDPLDFVNSILRKSSALLLDNVTAITWRHPYSYKKATSDGVVQSIEAWINIIKNMNPTFGNIKSLRLVFSATVQRNNLPRNFPIPVQSCGQREWWSYIETKYNSFLARLENTLSQNYPNVAFAHHVEVGHMVAGAGVTSKGQYIPSQWAMWTEHDYIPATATVIRVGPHTITTTFP